MSKGKRIKPFVHSLFKGQYLAMLLMLLPSLAVAQKTVMFRNPYADGLYMYLRDLSESMTTVEDMPGWQSATISAGSFFLTLDFFLQPGTRNECYDLNGINSSDQICPNKFTALDEWPADTMWIVPDVTTDKKVPTVSTQRPRRVYFLNPPEWESGYPELVIEGEGTRMVPDLGLCGWFYLDLFVEDGPFDLGKNIYFRLNSDTTQVADANGVSEIQGQPASINLETHFDDLGGEIYLNPADVSWSDSHMQLTGLCGFNLKATIRDFHHSTHPNFYFPNDNPPFYNYSSFTENDLTGSWNGTAYSYTSSPFTRMRSTGSRNPCEGIITGIVATNLDPTTGKPVYQEASMCFGDPSGSSDGAEWFDWLFKTDPSQTVNQKHCFDLSMNTGVQGYWEYDTQNEPDAGFFPMDWTPLLDSAKAPFNIQAPAQCGAPLKTSCKPYFDTLTREQVLAGPSSVGCDDGETANDWWYWGGRSCTMNSFHSSGYITGTDDDGNETQHDDYAPRNQHFCAEIHAEFTYQKGQTFLIRGDDDIWVFVNDSLVVDNGGMHLPAPGFVQMDSVSGLQEGSDYPLDIFFCDRLPTASNLTIKASFLLKQQSDRTLSFSEGCVESESSTLISNSGTSVGHDISNTQVFWQRGRLNILADSRSIQRAELYSATGELLYRSQNRTEKATRNARQSYEVQSELLKGAGVLFLRVQYLDGVVQSFSVVKPTDF